MWRPKSITTTLLLIVQFLLTLHISNGKPTAKEPFNHNTTTEPGDIDVREDENGNSSFLETMSVLLTVLSLNDTVTAEEDSPSPLNITANSTFYNYSTTTEPEYYDDHNLTTFSSTLDELEEDKNAVDDLDTLSSSIHLGSSTESSSLLSSLITDEMEVADSLDESVTATMLQMEGEENDGDGGGGGTGEADDHSRTVDAGDVSSKDDGSSRSHRDTVSASTDDSIIIASMSYNHNMNAVETFSRNIVITEEIISSSLLPDDTSSSGSSVQDSTSYSFTEVAIHE